MTAFRCGHVSLDRWLRKHAMRAQRSGTARTHAWVGGETAVVGYFAVAPTQVRRESVPRSLTGGVSVIPGYLLARLALDRALHGQGLGVELLVEALQVIVAAADTAAGRLIVVDAIDDAAASFYRHHDFRDIGAEGRRLVMTVATARAAVAP